MTHDRLPFLCHLVPLFGTVVVGGRQPVEVRGRPVTFDCACGKSTEVNGMLVDARIFHAGAESLISGSSAFRTGISTIPADWLPESERSQGHSCRKKRTETLAGGGRR